MQLWMWNPGNNAFLMVDTDRKMKFSIKDFISKCDEIRRKQRIWSHLLKKFLMENFIFCAVVNTRVPSGRIIGPTNFLLLINDLFDKVIFNIINYDETRYSKCDWVSYFWQQFQLDSELRFYFKTLWIRVVSDLLTLILGKLKSNLGIAFSF